MGKNNDIGKALTAFSQVALTVLSPIAACLVLGKLAVDKLGLPQYVIVIAIILGAISGFYSMIKYIINLTKSK